MVERGEGGMMIEKWKGWFEIIDDGNSNFPHEVHSAKEFLRRVYANPDARPNQTKHPFSVIKYNKP
jgi:hypothetical protein